MVLFFFNDPRWISPEDGFIIITFRVYNYPIAVLFEDFWKLSTVINKIVVSGLELMACYQKDQRYFKKYLIVSLLDNNKIANQRRKNIECCVS